jgi:hypothetical protein
MIDSLSIRFLCYLMMLFQMHKFVASNGRKTVQSKFKGMQKGTGRGLLLDIILEFASRIEENHENYSQDSQLLYQRFPTFFEWRHT